MSDQELFSSPARITHRIGTHGRFSLNNISGDIRLRGVDGNDVSVVARWDGHSDQPMPLAIRRGDGFLHIETEEKLGWFSFRNAGSIEFQVDVPRDAHVDIQAVSADIESHGLIGEQSYKTVSGDLVVDGSGGQIAVVTVSGDVSITAVNKAEVNATSTSGDIEVFAKTYDPLRLKTVSGDMAVRGSFAPGPQHTVESVSGDLLIEAFSGLTVDTKKGLDFSKRDHRPLVSGDGGANLRFRSLSGDVRLSGTSSDQPPQPPEAPAPPEPSEPPMSQEESLEILRALERGEIDVEEASRRLEGAGSRG